MKTSAMLLAFFVLANFVLVMAKEETPRDKVQWNLYITFNKCLVVLIFQDLRTSVDLKKDRSRRPHLDRTYYRGCSSCGGGGGGGGCGGGCGSYSSGCGYYKSSCYRGCGSRSVGSTAPFPPRAFVVYVKGLPPHIPAPAFPVAAITAEVIAGA